MSSFRKFYGRHHDLLTDTEYDHGYVPFVVVIITPVPLSWPITEILIIDLY
jgi:hypothetical protein